MNNRNFFPNMNMGPGMNPEQLFNNENTMQMMNLLQNNMDTMNLQQRVVFLENFQRNLRMMQQQTTLQSQGMMGNSGMRNMMQEAMRLQGSSFGTQQRPIRPRNVTPQTTRQVRQPVQTAKPILKGILKSVPQTNPPNVSKATVTQSSTVSTSENPEQNKIDLLKDRLKTYIQQTEEAVSALKRSSQSSVSSSQTSSVNSVSKRDSALTKTTLSSAKTVTSASASARNVTKSTTSSQRNPKHVTNIRGTKTTSQGKSATVTSQSTQGSKVEGQSIPTLVSSGVRKPREQPIKRKAEVAVVDKGPDSKRSKVTTPQVPVAAAQPDVVDEDPEHVQAQVFISNIPNDTTKAMILEILLHYKFAAPKVWIGHHNTMKNKICAFVKLPSLKDSKRVIAEMNGFPYKGIAMEIRFSAAADFIDYDVPESGLTQAGLIHKPSGSGMPISDTGVPAPAIIHQPMAMEGVQAAVPLEPVTFTQVPIQVYAGVPPIYPAPEGYATFIERDRRSLDRVSEGSYQREHRRSASPRNRHGHSPSYSPLRNRFSPHDSRGRHSSPGYSSHRRYSRSPEYSLHRRYSRSPENSSRRRYSRSPVHSSQRRYSRSPEYFLQRRYSKSPDYSVQRRYSRSPDYPSQRRYSRSPDYPSQRRYSRSPDYSSQRRYSRSPSFGRGRSPDPFVYTPPRHRSLSPGFSTHERYDYQDGPLEDYERETSFHQIRRSSLSPVRSNRESPYRRSPVHFQGTPTSDARTVSEVFCVQIGNLPEKIRDVELQVLIKDFKYDRIRLEELAGKAMADIYTSTSGEAKIIVQELDGSQFMGSTLTAEWHREQVLRDTGSKDQSSWDRVKSPLTSNRRVNLREKPLIDNSRDREQQRDNSRDREQRANLRDRQQNDNPRDREKQRDNSRDREQRASLRDRQQRDNPRDREQQRDNSRDREQRANLRDRERRDNSRDREQRTASKKSEKALEVKNENSLFQSLVDASYPNAPVLGRKYIKEFSYRGNKVFAVYLCILCEGTMNCKDIADHMMSYKHRLKCIKRSHPKIYDEICQARNKVDMLGQCAKYALQLENKKEKVVRVESTRPIATADEHLKKIKADRKREAEKEEEKKAHSKKKEEKKEEEKDKPDDSTSDIFKRIEAIKKKFEATKAETETKVKSTGKCDLCGVQYSSWAVEQEHLCSKRHKRNVQAEEDASVRSEESPAKKLKLDEEKTSTFSFKDLTKRNKALADSIQKGISSVRERVEKQKNENESKNSQVDVGKKTTENDKVTKQLPDKKEQMKVTQKAPPSSNDKPEKKKEVSEGKTANNVRVSSNTKEVISKVSEDKTASNVRVSSNKEVITKGKANEEEKGNTVPKGEEVIVIESDGEDKLKKLEKDSGVKKTNIKNPVKKPESNKGGTEVPESDSTQIKEDITTDPGLFSEELGDMEDEEAVEETSTPAEGRMSSHPQSMLKKFFDIQLLKDSDNSGIIGLQYITEVIPNKGSKSHVFTCGLCDVKCVRNAIVDHIIGYKHRMKYFEVHHFDIYSSIMRMDQSRKFLNAECIRCAKVVQDKEGLKTIMTVTEAEFKQKKKGINQKQPPEKVQQEITVERRTGQKPTPMSDEMKAQSNPQEGKKTANLHAVSAQTNKTTATAPTAAEAMKTVEEVDELKELSKMDVSKSGSAIGEKIREAKAWAKLVDKFEGRETVELYKYMQQKPDVPMLGLNNVTEFQGLYGKKSKSATYNCQLCFPSKKIEGTPAMYEHLIGLKHMENYLKKHFPEKMIHLKLITQRSAKVIYLHNQAKLLCQSQVKKPESIYVVNVAQLEEEKKALELAKAAAKAVEEAAKAEAAALAAAKEASMPGEGKASKSKSTSTIEGVIDLTAEEVKYEPPVAHLYSMIVGLQDIPLVGLSYITEIQGIMADKVPPRYECRLCESDLITSNYINAHMTSSDHRLRFLKANYPVFYSKAEWSRDLTEKFCREIEEQFGRESISIKKRILVRPDGSVVYSDPTVVKAPVESKDGEKEAEQDMIETIEMMDEVNVGRLAEGEKPEEGIFFYKIVEGLDCTPMLGLQYIKEIQHPSLNVPPIYLCEVCNIASGPYLNTKNILKHVCSKDHRLKFMKENHFHIFQEINALEKEDLMKIAIDKHTKEIESKVGRGTVTKIKSDRRKYWRKTNLDAISKESAEQEEVDEEDDDEKAIADEDQPQYRCKKCDRIVPRDRRTHHIMSVHVNCYRCNSCQLSFPSRVYLQKHVNTHHDTGTVVPKKIVSSNFNLRRWFKWYTARGTPMPKDRNGKLLYVCKICQMVVDHAETEKHYVFYHAKGYKCKVCDVPHGTNTALEEHYKAIHKTTESVPVKNYTGGMKLSTNYIPVYSLKPPKPTEKKKEKQPDTKSVSTQPNKQPVAAQRTKELEVEKPKLQVPQTDKQPKVHSEEQQVVDKYHCKRCQNFFYKLEFAEHHFKSRHQYDYPCCKCILVFDAAWKLDQHYKYGHRLNENVEKSVMTLGRCFDVSMKGGKRMSLEGYLKLNPQMDLATHSTGETSSVVTATTKTTTAATKAASATPMAVVATKTTAMSMTSSATSKAIASTSTAVTTVTTSGTSKTIIAPSTVVATASTTTSKETSSASKATTSSSTAVTTAITTAISKATTATLPAVVTTTITSASRATSSASKATTLTSASVTTTNNSASSKAANVTSIPVLTATSAPTSKAISDSLATVITQTTTSTSKATSATLTAVTAATTTSTVKATSATLTAITAAATTSSTVKATSATLTAVTAATTTSTVKATSATLTAVTAAATTSTVKATSATLTAVTAAATTSSTGKATSATLTAVTAAATTSSTGKATSATLTAVTAAATTSSTGKATSATLTAVTAATTSASIKAAFNSSKATAATSAAVTIAKTVPVMKTCSTSKVTSATTTVSSATASNVPVTKAATQEQMTDKRIQKDELAKDDNKTSSSAVKVPATSTDADTSTKTTTRTFCVEEFLSAREDEKFVWRTEYAKIKDRIQIGGITNTARKCKFMMSYTSSNSSYPLIGLQMITELQQKSISALPWYLCELCKDRITCSGISSHLASVKHRVKYMESHHKFLYGMVRNKPFPTVESLTRKVEALAQDVLRQERIKFNMTVMIELPPTNKELAAIAAKEKADQERTAVEDSDVYEVIIIDDDSSCSSVSIQQEISTEEASKKKLSASQPSSSSNHPSAEKSTSESLSETKNEKSGSISDKGTEQRKTSHHVSSSKQDEDKGNRDRERSGRRSPKRREQEERGSRERRSIEERRSRKSDRTRSSYRRRSRSRDKSRRSSRSPRSSRDHSTRKNEKDSDKGSSKNSSRNTKNITEHHSKGGEKLSLKSSTSVSIPSVPSEKNENVSNSEKLTETQTGKVEQETKEDNFSIEELELISKCLEEQLMEDEEGTCEENDTEENEKDTNMAYDTSFTGNNLENNKPSNDCSNKMNSNFSGKSQKKEIVSVDQNIIENVAPKESQEQKADNKSNVEIHVTMSDTSANAENQQNTSTRNKLDQRSTVEININLHQKDFDSEKTVKNKMESRQDEKSKPGKDMETSAVQNSVPVKSSEKKETSNKKHFEKNKDEKVIKEKINEMDLKLDNIGSRTHINMNAPLICTEMQVSLTEDEIQHKNKEVEAYKNEKTAPVESSTLTVNLDKDDCPSDNILTEELTEELSSDAEFADFVMAELGEDFVTIDDYNDLPADINLEPVESIPETVESLTNIRDKSRIEMKSDITPDNIAGKETKFTSDSSSSDLSLEINLKTDEKLNPNDQSMKTNEAGEKSTVCVVEVSMGQTALLENIASTEDTNNNAGGYCEMQLDPYDDSGDMEFILTDEVLSMDEPGEMETEIQVPKTELRDENISKQSEQPNSSLPRKTNHSSFEEKPAIEVKLEIKDSLDKQNCQADNQIDRKGCLSKTNKDVAIGSSAIETDDDDSIEEIFLGGDFVTVDTVDESKEEHYNQDMDTKEEEIANESFLAGDFVTLDEVDEDSPENQKQSTANSEFTESKERSVDRAGERASKDISDSKRSSHDSISSRIRDTEKQSSSKKEGPRHRSISTRSSTNLSKEFGTSSSRKSPASSQPKRLGDRISKRELVVSSVEIGSAASDMKSPVTPVSEIEVNVQVLRKQSGKEEKTKSNRSGLRGSPSLGHDTQSTVDSCSFLGIPIKSTGDSKSRTETKKTDQSEGGNASKEKTVKPRPGIEVKLEETGKGNTRVKLETSNVGRQTTGHTSASKEKTVKPRPGIEVKLEESGKGNTRVKLETSNVGRQTTGHTSASKEKTVKPRPGIEVKLEESGKGNTRVKPETSNVGRYTIGHTSAENVKVKGEQKNESESGIYKARRNDKGRRNERKSKDSDECEISIEIG